MKKVTIVNKKTIINEAFYLAQLENFLFTITSKFLSDLNKARNKEDVLSKHRDIINRKTILLQGNTLYMDVLKDKRQLYGADKNLSEFDAIAKACVQHKVNLKEAIVFLAEYESLFKGWYEIGLIYSKDPEKKVFAEKPNLSNNLKKAEKPIENNNTYEGNIVPHTDKIPNPYFLKDKVQVIGKELGLYFSMDDAAQLHLLLTNWNENLKEKLVFKASGKKLADALLRLHKAGFIIGATKRELQRWALKNFSYWDRKNQPKNFTKYYLAQCISTDKLQIENPLFEIVDGKLVRP
jgi:hypothetical protein